MKKLKVVGLILFICVLSCNQNKILDLLQALKHYSYSSYTPLSSKQTKIETELLGAYEYNSLPIIISKRDNYTYNIKFLAMDSAKSNQTTVAHITYLGDYRFLNIKIGDSYTFLRVKVDLEKDLNVYAVKSSLGSYVKSNEMKEFLTKNGDQEYGQVTYKSSYTDSLITSSKKIYNHFLFNRITIGQAYALQREKIYGGYAKKYADCSDYNCYNKLYKENPYDTLLQISVLNIYKKSNTISELYFFTKKFPNNELTPIALEKIKELEHYNKELKRFELVKNEHTIPAYQEFKNSCDILSLKDSADSKVDLIVKGINQQTIEWKWSSNKKEEAIQDLFYKIDLSKDSLDVNKYSKLLTTYTLKYKNNATTREAIKRFDILIYKDINKNTLLNLYQRKAFLLWSTDSIDSCLDTFRGQMESSYLDDTPFRRQIRRQYKIYKDLNISFPDQKANWKKIKKLR